jgi:F-type H+-transporting ATPase subunit gamma
MANLKQLKLKRQSVQKTAKVTRAMEAVSAVKMRKSQELAISGRAFASLALRILNALSLNLGSAKHPFVKQKKDGKDGLVLITSDKGLAGSLNSAILKKAQAFLDEKGAENVLAIAVGRRAGDFLKARKVEILRYQENIKHAV